MFWVPSSPRVPTSGLPADSAAAVCVCNSALSPLSLLLLLLLLCVCYSALSPLSLLLLLLLLLLLCVTRPSADTAPLYTLLLSIM